MADQIWYEDGKVRVENGSSIVVGAGTFWLTHVRPGDMFAATHGGPAREFYEVLTVDDDRQLTLAKLWQGATENDVEYAVIRNFTGRWSISADLAYQVENLVRQFKSALQNNLKGDKGDPGRDGNTILGGVGAPSPTEGKENDWYLNSSTWDVYRKESGGWILRGTLKGPKGDPGRDGVQWYYDETPAANVGNVGDINFNGMTGDIHRRTATGWTPIGNFRGPQGIQGIQGLQGPKGDPARWHSGTGTPTGATGTNGDMYLNSATGEFYQKSSGVWVSKGSIKGPVGEQGPTGRPGVNFRGVWDIQASYEIRDTVQYLGNAWVARTPNVGVSPPLSNAVVSNEAWDLLVAKGTDGQGSGDMLKSVYDPENQGKVLAAKEADHATTATTATKAGEAESVHWDKITAVPAAAADKKGVVQFATTAESLAGEAVNRAVTPEGLKATVDAAVGGIVIPDPVEIVDALDSDRTDAALSAAQGKVLKTADAAIVEALNEKAEAEHQHEIADVDGLQEALQNIPAPDTGMEFRKFIANLMASNWTVRASAVDNNWYSVCWSPELRLFCAVAGTGTGNRVMTSPNGINWTACSSAADNAWRSVCWSPELRLFCAVATSGTGNRVMTSPDGINWTACSSAADNNWISICWSPELRLFCAVAYTGTGNRVMTSPDGINWTARFSAADNNWYSVCWSPELRLFCAVALTGTGNRVMTNTFVYMPGIEEAV